MTDFTAEEKYREAERELKMRQRVYPGIVASGSMTQPLADRRIAIMEAIADDYRKLSETETPRLL